MTPACLRLRAGLQRCLHCHCPAAVSVAPAAAAGRRRVGQASRHHHDGGSSPTSLRGVARSWPPAVDRHSSSSSSCCSSTGRTRVVAAAAGSSSIHGGSTEQHPAVPPPPPPPPPRQQQQVNGWVVNKQPINGAMTPELYAYMLSLTPEHELLAALRQETAGVHGGHMQISPEQGQFMALLVQLMGATSAIEVGVFTGYSSLAVALALPPDGRLVAFDRDARTMAVAQRYWEAAGVAHKVTARLGPGVEGLQQLLAEEGPGSFDFAFIDADKRNYQAYFDLALQLVRRGGCVVVDNVLFYGRVADPERSDKATDAIRAFNAALAADARVRCCIVPIGDGVALCRKL